MPAFAQTPPHAPTSVQPAHSPSPFATQFLQRQQVCLFADIVGSTCLALGLPHERYAWVMMQAVQRMLGSLQRYGAQVLPHQGDAVLGLWDEWQVSQALAAAQHLHDNLQHLGKGLAAELPAGMPRLQLRIGVASGLVCCGVLDGSPSAYGLPLHLARRLCSAALPGETLVCERVAALLPPEAAQSLYCAALSGFAEPVTLHGALPLAARLTATGRVTEFTVLSEVQLNAL